MRKIFFLPKVIQKKALRQLKFLVSNLRHPSIRAKKIIGSDDIWEGRVDKFYRFTFKMEDDEIRLRRVGRHDRTLKSP